MTGSQPQAILWAQWRSFLNHGIKRSGGSFAFSSIFLLLWYGMWAFGAYAVAVFASDPDSIELFDRILPPALSIVFLYWQVVPILMASTGISLDLARLTVYPIPHGQLFAIETLLRFTAAAEMLFVLSGLGIGLLLNPGVPKWAPLSLIVFTAFNVLLSAGLRDLFVRLLARKGVRELFVFAVVLAAAAPQALLLSNMGERWRSPFESGFGPWWPWSLTARLAAGHPELLPLLIVLLWTALSYGFARHQFEKSLRAGIGDSSSPPERSSNRPTVADRLLRIPDRLLPDPIAVLVVKEIRFLSRAPRFRLLFLMGFSFGLLIWLPLTLRAGPDSPMRGNYLSVVSVYALLLMGEALFWNIFGMDRAAAQTYFVMPVPFASVLIAKNIAAAFFILLEIAIVALFCLLLRMPVTLNDTAEAFAVTAVLALTMLAMGNMISTRYPRAVDPKQSWRNSSGRTQAFLLVLYPLASLPVFLAYGARFAFESSLAFWGILALGFLIGAVVYAIALESATAFATSTREKLIQILSEGESVAG